MRHYRPRAFRRGLPKRIRTKRKREAKKLGGVVMSRRFWRRVNALAGDLSHLPRFQQLQQSVDAMIHAYRDERQMLRRLGVMVADEVAPFDFGRS